MAAGADALKDETVELGRGAGRGAGRRIARRAAAPAAIVGSQRDGQTTSHNRTDTQRDQRVRAALGFLDARRLAGRKGGNFTRMDLRRNKSGRGGGEHYLAEIHLGIPLKQFAFRVNNSSHGQVKYRSQPLVVIRPLCRLFANEQ